MLISQGRHYGRLKNMTKKPYQAHIYGVSYQGVWVVWANSEKDAREVLAHELGELEEYKVKDAKIYQLPTTGAIMLFEYDDPNYTG